MAKSWVVGRFFCFVFLGGMSFQLPFPAFNYLLIIPEMTNYLCASQFLAAHLSEQLGEITTTGIKHDGLACQTQEFRCMKNLIYYVWSVHCCQNVFQVQEREKKNFNSFFYKCPAIQPISPTSEEAGSPWKMVCRSSSITLLYSQF